MTLRSTLCKARKKIEKAKWEGDNKKDHYKRDACVLQHNRLAFQNSSTSVPFWGRAIKVHAPYPHVCLSSTPRNHLKSLRYDNHYGQVTYASAAHIYMTACYPLQPHRRKNHTQCRQLCSKKQIHHKYECLAARPSSFQNVPTEEE